MAEILSSLGIHWQSFVAQAVNFGILAFVLYKFVIKGALASLDARVQRQEEAEQNSKDIESRLKEVEESKKAVIEEARKESRKILEETEKSSLALSEKLKNEAERATQRLIEEARVKMESERNLLISDIKKELLSIVSLSIETTTLKDLSKENKEKLAKDAAEEATRLYEVKK